MRLRLGIAGNGLRALLALAVLVICVQDWPAARASATLFALPPVDHEARGRALHVAGQSEAALLVIDEGLRRHPQPDAARARLLALRSELRQAERDDWQGPVRSAARGALTGTASDAPGLVAAVVADLFVFGDIRDLTIQSIRGLRGQPVDPVIVALSVAGLALTAVPAVDSGTALLKAARRSDALSPSMTRHIMRRSQQAARSGDIGPLRAIIDDATGLTHAMGVGPAQRVLRGIKDPDQLHHAAQLARAPGGAYALWAGGAPFVRWLPGADAHARGVALLAARKGEAGLRHLVRHARLMARPHLVVGLMKGMYKGHTLALMSQYLRRHAALIAALAGGWLLFELGAMSLRLRYRR